MSLDQKINSKIVDLEFVLRLVKDNTAMSFEKPEEWKKRIYEIEGGIAALNSVLNIDEHIDTKKYFHKEHRDITTGQITHNVVKFVSKVSTIGTGNAADYIKEEILNFKNDSDAMLYFVESTKDFNKETVTYLNT